MGRRGEQTGRRPHQKAAEVDRQRATLFVGIIASFWVWIAAVMGVWWERKAGPAAVATMEKLSADVSAS
jgi:hypothetical protein